MADVERIKSESRLLRGTLPQDLQNMENSFSADNAQLLKFHGVYQQDNRDSRKGRSQEGTGKEYSFMVRSSIPGGQLNAAQYLAHDALADEVGDGSLRITSRQGIQLHGVAKGDLRSLMRRLNEFNVTTWGACGDVVRNVVASPAPIRSDIHEAAQALAVELNAKLKPRNEAYTEVWLNGEPLPAEKVFVGEDPVYGDTYLPRKFKIGIAIPPRNDVDIYTHDLGFVAHVENGRVEGYTLLVGGGMGMSFGRKDTHPALGKPLLYVKKEDAADAALAVVLTQRDYGNRTDRKQARLKYLIESKGIAWFRNEVEARLGKQAENPKVFRFTSLSDDLGWHEQGDGKFYLGVWVEAGRIRDYERVKYRSAFREIAERFKPELRLTPNHNIIFHKLKASDKAEVERVLRAFNIPDYRRLSAARQTGMACVALPTCGLALAESERAFPSIMDKIDAILRELGIAQDPLLIRMTGCPNGCARPYNADFAFVGRGPGKYAMFVGGSYVGDRLAVLAERSVDIGDIPAKVKSYLAEFAANRAGAETFSEYWGRTRDVSEAASEQFHDQWLQEVAALAPRKPGAVAAG